MFLPIEETCILLQWFRMLVLLMALLGIDMVDRSILFEMIFTLYFRLQAMLLLTLAHALVMNLKDVHSSSESLLAYVWEVLVYMGMGWWSLHFLLISVCIVFFVVFCQFLYRFTMDTWRNKLLENLIAFDRLSLKWLLLIILANWLCLRWNLIIRRECSRSRSHIWVLHVIWRVRHFLGRRSISIL